MWFEKLTGFSEVSPKNVRENITISGNTLISRVNSRKLYFGKLQIATLAQLKKETPPLKQYNAKIKVKEIVADVQKLHCEVENTNSLFQAASQFNLLEMVNPAITPEHGIDRYEFDRTQGPACAIACGAGTIYRNYFTEVNGQMGQTADNQINCLDGISKALQNDKLNLWSMQNGYALFNKNGLLAINKIIAHLSDEGREELKEELKTGIQWNTEVTLSDTKHKVSQIYCSALPVAYSDVNSSYWEPFARIILEAAYESTLYAGILNMLSNYSNKLFLTLIGGGAFGNKEQWILDSLQKTIRKFKKVPLDISIVSYGRSNPDVVKCINETLN